MPVFDVQTPSPGPVGTLVDSGPSITATATMATSLWYLIDCEAPSQSIEIEVKEDGSGLQVQTPEMQTQHDILGASYTTILADTIKGATFPLIVDFLTDAAFQAFDALRVQQKTLLLQSPWNEQWYVRIGPDMNPTVQTAAGLYRVCNFVVYEQARP